MIRINIKNGETFKLDLNDEAQAKRLLSLLQNWDFQEQITAITTLRQYSRKHRCPNRGCRNLVTTVCPSCGVIQDNGSFKYTGNQYTLTRPQAFNNVNFGVELIPSNTDDATRGIEKLICNAGGVQLMISTYGNQPSTRVTLREIGEQRYNPLMR